MYLPTSLEYGNQNGWNLHAYDEVKELTGADEGDIEFEHHIAYELHEPFSAPSQSDQLAPIYPGSYANTAPELPHTNHAAGFYDEESGIWPSYTENSDTSQAFMEDARYVLGHSAGFGNNISTMEYGPASANDHDANLGQFHETNIVDISSEYRVQDPTWPPQQSISSTLSVTPASSQPSGENPMTCPRGCRGTFGRTGEYRRHMRKHEARNIFCTQPGCTMAFYRKDKLSDHLRQAHRIIQTGRTRRAAAIGPMSAASTSSSA
ncbi:hypothetical protein HBH77_081530 [Parastagonospora nodorum]|nr:hypothetical protein HBH77_081530 [Parastagonospora nodorum]